MNDAIAAHEFRVHVRNDDSHHARIVFESSFEAAVVAYIETGPHASAEGSVVSVVVHDIDSGHEHCFRIDLTTGETESCG